MARGVYLTTTSSRSPSRFSTVSATSWVWRVKRRSTRLPATRRSAICSESIRRAAPGAGNDTASTRRRCRSQTRLQQQKRGAARPGLRRAGDRVERGKRIGPSMEAADQFGETMKLDHLTQVECGHQDAPRVVRQPIAGESRGDDRVVVRPHRSVVVRHRVVPHRIRRDRADTPPAERRIGEQRFGNNPGPLGIDDAREQAVSGVRRTDAAGALACVERQGVGAEILAPEGGLEALRRLSACGPPFSAVVIALSAASLAAPLHAACPCIARGRWGSAAPFS